MQFEIGEITRGDDNLDFAKFFYREAAEKGDADAQNNLGVIYERTGDYEKSLFWYKQAADNGSVTALVNLGKMYQYGRGSKVDANKASKLYQMFCTPNIEPAATLSYQRVTLVGRA